MSTAPLDMTSTAPRAASKDRYARHPDPWTCDDTTMESVEYGIGMARPRCRTGGCTCTTVSVLYGPRLPTFGR